MVSEELIQFWLFVLGIIVCILSVALFIYFIDRARREGPFHFLGYAIAGSWSWQAGQALLEGEIGGVPMSPSQVQKLAVKAVKDKRQEKIAGYSVQDLDKKTLDGMIEELEKRKKILDAQTDSTIPPGIGES